MNTIYAINGPVVKVKDTDDFCMLEMVYVGVKKLVGEVIGINSDETTIQVYESTTGLKPGEPVVGSGMPMSATLGPGILSNIFDGIERPLKKLEEISGAFIAEGANVSALDTVKKYDVTVKVKVGDKLTGGDIYAVCPETPVIEHRCMVHPDLSGEVVWTAENGKYTVNDTVVKLKSADGAVHELTLCQKWPIKQARPFKNRLPINKPLITGQRIIDTILPIAKGGTAAIPGGFGTGKTMTQHQLAKWCDADIIVYIGCGERGNEMTQVLEEFSELVDPRTGKALTDRTVLIANTSNMPVAAREASIYTGITLAEYYRDMGYHIAIMADSTSRWAEALREMSGRLEEMPGEEGYPAYLSSRLAEFYERAGYVKCLGSEGLEGSITAIGAVSPPGGDTSEPVSQATLRIVKVFWGLSANLAYRRHFPAIDWLKSYSLYDLNEYFNEELDQEWSKQVSRAMQILQEEAKLDEIVRLVGVDSLEYSDRLKLDVARSIREDYLHQNAFHEVDTYTSLAKQFGMLKVILKWYNGSVEALKNNVSYNELTKMNVLTTIGRMKYISENEFPEKVNEIYKEMDNEFEKLMKGANE